MGRTSFRDLSKGQACTSLQLHICREDQDRQGTKRFPGEKVGLIALLVCQLEYPNLDVGHVEAARTFSRYCSSSDTADRSFSASIGS